VALDRNNNLWCTKVKLGKAASTRGYLFNHKATAALIEAG